MKNNKNSTIFMVCVLTVVLIFLIYSNSQKRYFLEKDLFYEWIQFNTNGILIIIGAIATIVAVLLTIKHSDNVRNENELSKFKMDVRLLEHEIIKFYNFIEKDFEFIESKILWLDYEEIYTMSPYKIKFEDVDTMIKLTLNIENKFIDKKDELDKLRKNIVSIYEIQKEIEINKKTDERLITDKVNIYNEYLYSEYKTNFKNLKDVFFKMDEKYRHKRLDLEIYKSYNNDSSYDDSADYIRLMLEDDHNYKNLFNKHGYLNDKVRSLDKFNRRKYEFIRSYNVEKSL